MAETAHPNLEFKAGLRPALIAARTALGATLRASHDAAIAATLQVWLQQHPASVLGVYWPIRGEPDLRPWYRAWLPRGVQLALPLMIQHDAALQFGAWRPDDPVVFDRWGIATPAVVRPVVPDALLIPCVGFSAGGFRLGYGGGYYDRTLAQVPRPQAIGIAYECGRTAFAGEKHDIAMDIVITEAGIARDDIARPGITETGQE